jgi:GNAT superfamily N-acetyltransferase
VIRGFISELAEYEKQPEQVQTTEADICRDGFGAQPEFRALIAEWHGVPAGFAIFFSHYSTWRGRGLYLEDLFVRPEFRRRGIGKALISALAALKLREKRLFSRWTVLDRNQSATRMYGKSGADFLDEWRTVLLTGKSLKKLAEHLPITCAKSNRPVEIIQPPQ